MDGKVPYRVGWVGGGLMLGIAIVADLLQVVLTLTVALAPVGFIVAVVAEGFIFFYFWMRRVHFLKGKGGTGRFIGFLLTTIVELIPFLDALPTLMAYTFYTIHSSRKEDRESFKKKQQEIAAQNAAQEQQEIEEYSRWTQYEAYAQKQGVEAAERKLEDA